VIWKGEYIDERDARFINDRVHANIQKDGTFSVIPEIRGGITRQPSYAGSRKWPTSTACLW
jgi:NAD(P)H-nitrite reductase large subunit